MRTPPAPAPRRHRRRAREWRHTQQLGGTVSSAHLLKGSQSNQHRDERRGLVTVAVEIPLRCIAAQRQRLRRESIDDRLHLLAALRPQVEAIVHQRERAADAAASLLRHAPREHVALGAETERYRAAEIAD